MASRGIEIFGPATLERNIIARANHIATAEQWGAPQVRCALLHCRRTDADVGSLVVAATAASRIRSCEDQYQSHGRDGDGDGKRGRG